MTDCMAQGKAHFSPLRCFCVRGVPALAQKLQCVGLKAGDIAPADVQKPGHLQLGQRRLAGKAVPQQNDLPFPGGQAVQKQSGPADLVLLFAGILHAEAVLQNIGQSQRGSFIGFQRFLQRDGAAGLALPPELHPELVRYPLLTDFLHCQGSSRFHHRSCRDRAAQVNHNLPRHRS